MINEWGEMVDGFSNMKKAYEWLLGMGWIEPVNYSYFSRTINKDNNRFWEYKYKMENLPYPKHFKCKFVPLQIR